MTIIIEVYIVICIALLLFDLGFLYTKKRRTEVLYPRNNQLQQLLRQEMEKYRREGEFTPEFLADLKGRLGKVRNLITLVSEFEDYPEMKQLFAPCIFSLVDTYSRRNESEKAYYAYVISLMDYDTQVMPHSFPGKFMLLLDSGSVYTFSNTMNALYHFGQTHLLIQALDKVNDRGEFYHKKLLIDGLLASRTDFSEFCPLVLERFSGYHPYLQAALLDFFRMKGWDVEALCYSLMSRQETQDEVRYSAMRYFMKCPTARSDAFFLELLRTQEKDWLSQMLAIQALSRNDSPEVREVIRGKITSPDWYVRLNAARYLYRHHLSKKEIYDILALGDRYASEILLYCCQEDPVRTAYILKIQTQMEQEVQAPEQQSSLIGKEARV